MKKRFNITGVCFPEEHYMVDISNKINDIFAMVEQGDYFVINRPRQYGKTTTLYLLNRFLKTSGDFLPINTSFEGIGEEGFANAAVFIDAFFLLLKEKFSSSGDDKLVKFIDSEPLPDRIDKLGLWINKLVKESGKKIVLMIDEVDKSSNNQLFLDFLGMLRNKYLNRREPGQFTFHSVILAGVHDVKSLKAKIKKKDEEPKFNSPWNIAVDFKVDLSFSVNEIQSMLEDYSTEQHVTLDIPYFAEQLFYLTSGYPFLVSRLCKIIDEEIKPGEQWTQSDIDRAANILLTENNTNFQSLVKNLENNQSLYDMVYRLVLEGENIGYNLDNPLI
ncbi:MAG TPA: AAA-like domain-containing protein, partial [Candidatus Kapabacteria bacterium]|nr:AAA-like domain-containing protein [Candidatus Kapabacteria bacterium]